MRKEEVLVFVRADFCCTFFETGSIDMQLGIGILQLGVLKMEMGLVCSRNVPWHIIVHFHVNKIF